VKRSVELLTASHACKDFTCGDAWLDSYLRRFAIKNMKLGYAKSYVLVARDGSKKVHGFYTLSMASVLFRNLPDALLASGTPRYPMPVGHMGCLAVDKAFQRQGLGEMLLIDALRRVLAAADIIGARAFDVKALDRRVADWYAGYGFIPYKDDLLRLFLPLDTARAIVAAAL